MRHVSWEDAAGMVLLLAIVALLVLAWLVVKAGELVLRMTVQHAENPWLRLTLGSFLALATAIALTYAQYPVLNAAAMVSLVALVLCCKALELYHDELLQREWDRDLVVDAVLHEPWFSLDHSVGSHRAVGAAV